jgi:hypothetical protein
MDKMNNKPIKQMGAIETSILNQSNTPLVPPQFQTGAYVDPTSVVQNPPVVPQPNMGNQMGATPIYQTDPTDPPEKQMKKGKMMVKQPESFRLAQSISTGGDTLSYKVIPNYTDSDGVTVNKKVPIPNKLYNSLKNQ